MIFLVNVQTLICKANHKMHSPKYRIAIQCSNWFLYSLALRLHQAFLINFIENCKMIYIFILSYISSLYVNKFMIELAHVSQRTLNSRYIFLVRRLKCFVNKIIHYLVCNFRFNLSCHAWQCIGSWLDRHFPGLLCNEML